MVSPESANLTTNNSGKSAVYSKQARRLGQLVQSYDARGGKPRDLNFLQAAVREVARMEKTLERSRLTESTIDISGYNKTSIDSHSIHYMAGRLFVSLSTVDEHTSDIFNLDGEKINKHPCAASGAYISDRSFFYRNEPVFELCYDQSKDSVQMEIVNEKGENVGLFNSSDMYEILLPVVDGNNQLRYFGKSLVDADAMKDFGQLFDLNNKPVTQSNLYFSKWGILNDHLAYVAEEVGGYQYVVYGGSMLLDLNHDGLKYYFSRPFNLNGQVYSFKAEYSEEYKKSTLYLINISTKEHITLPFEEIFTGEIESIDDVINSGYSVYLVLTKNKKKCVFKLNSDLTGGEMDFNLKDSQDISKVEVLAGQLVVTIKTETREEQNPGIVQRKYSVSINNDLDWNIVDVHRTTIMATIQPKTILGETGQIFYIDEFYPYANLMVDNVPVPLWEEGDQIGISGFNIINDKIFWGQRKYTEDDVEDRMFLYVDGVKTKYHFEKIVKVVFDQGKYFVVGLEGDKLVVREVEV